MNYKKKANEILKYISKKINYAWLDLHTLTMVDPTELLVKYEKEYPGIRPKEISVVYRFGKYKIIYTSQGCEDKGAMIDMIKEALAGSEYENEKYSFDVAIRDDRR